MINTWFLTRQKRELTMILPALIAFSDICVGEVWSGNEELQMKFEDELQKRSITAHGSLRSRKIGQGGGGIRTLFTQLSDLGLVFVEDENKKCRLTLIGEALVKAEITFVDGMKMQLRQYQYPSATRLTGSGAVSDRFRVHPFVFMLRLMIDKRLDYYLTMDEMRYFVIQEGVSDDDSCLNEVVDHILSFRKTNVIPEGREDTSTKKYWDIANTFFNYLSLTQFVDRGQAQIIVRKGKEKEIEAFIAGPYKFIPFPEQKEIYARKYGRGTATKDLRDFSKLKTSTAEIKEHRIKSEYALLRLQMPITKINEEVVGKIVEKTGIDERFVEKFLRRNFPNGNVDDFFLTYKEYATGGRKYATEFELATVEVCKKIFHLNAVHVGPIGNTPDVFVESDSEQYCGIIDNKAYEKKYSIIGDHKRRMVDEYIPNVASYAKAKYPLAFFSYISNDFSTNINSQILDISRTTSVDGSAMPVDLFIDFAQDYAKKGYSHKDIKRVFSVNREVLVADVI